MRYLSFLAALMAAAILPGCSSSGDIPSYQQLMTGMWAYECKNADGYCRYDVYMPEGRMQVFGYNDDEEKSAPYSATANWHISTYQVCYEITESSGGDLTVGDKWCDDIKMLNSETLRIRASRKVATTTFTRL